MATKTRASGMTAGEEEAQRKAEKLDQPLETKLNQETERRFKAPGFARMRFTWRDRDYPVARRAIDIAESHIIEMFADAYELMNDVYDMVRQPEVDEQTGEIQMDRHGFKTWKRTAMGGYDEDFTRLSHRQKEDLLFRITTRIFDWRQRAGNLWGEAMLAKTQWEEGHAWAYDEPMTGTIDDRNAYANRNVAEEKYFAVFKTLMSRKADSVVSSMELLAQRIRDSMFS